MCVGLDKWFHLTPISRDDQVQGEILVETRLESFGEVSFKGKNLAKFNAELDGF